MMVVDEGQSGSAVHLLPGEVLAIRLKENPSTGYRWSVESADGLAPEDGASSASLPGAAGVREFRFRAVATGPHQLSLKHWRDWQGEGSVIGRYQIHVNIG